MTVQCDRCQRAVPSGAATCEICGGPTTPLGAAPADTWTAPARVPDPQSPAYAAPVGGDIRLVRGLSMAVVGLLGIGLLVDLVAALVGGHRSQLVGDVIAGKDVPLSDLESSDAIYGAVGIGQLLFLLATGVVYLVWFKRVNDNLRSLGAPLRHSPGWAVGAWFVPILNLFRPKQMHDDVWVAAGTLADPERRVPGKPGLITVWWAAFLISGAVGRLAFSAGQGDDLEAIRTSAQVGVFGDLLAVVTAVLVVFVVRGITARHDAGIAALRSPTPVG